MEAIPIGGAKPHIGCAGAGGASTASGIAAHPRVLHRRRPASRRIRGYCIDGVRHRGASAGIASMTSGTRPILPQCIDGVCRVQDLWRYN